MITPERLAMLEFQAEHDGLTPMRVDKLNNAGIAPQEQRGPGQITVMAGELKEFLAAYKEQQK